MNLSTATQEMPFQPGTTQHPPLFNGLEIAVVAPFAPHNSGIMYQAEVLTQCFRQDGASVLTVTHVQNRVLRPFATIFELVWQRSRYHVVCCQAFSYKNWINAALAVAAARVLGKRIILVYRGGAFAEFVDRYGWAVLPTLRRVDQLVTPSDYLGGEFRRRSLSAIVIPNVIEVAEWPHRRRLELPPRLLWVRHLRSGYNPLMALEVLHKIQRYYPDATLRMAGDGDMERQLRTAIAERELQGVTLLGHISGRQLAREYDEAAIFINTTNYDNQPRSVLEAMACGLPVVSTNVGGIPYMLEPGRHAILVPPNDANSMTTAILELLQNPPGALVMADAARAHVETFSWKSSRKLWASTLRGNPGS
jgi:phenylacetate-CoA ligase